MITDRTGLHRLRTADAFPGKSPGDEVARHHLESLVNFSLVLPTPLVGYFAGKPKDSEDTFSSVTPINFRESGEMLHY